MKNTFLAGVMLAMLALCSCSFPNRMFKTPKDYKFAVDTTKKEQSPYLIHVNDWLEMHIFSNQGFKLVDVTQSSITSSAPSEGIQYLVEENGEVKLPIIGRVNIKGLSIKDAETMLQEKYSYFYQDPFILLRVVNRHAMVFQGDGGKGTLIVLENDHTNLFEALALAGGVSEYSKAKQIKIVRGDLNNPEIYIANISSIEGLMNSTIQIYPNDIIYIDSGSNFRKRLVTDFLPYLSVFTSILVLVTYFQNN